MSYHADKSISSSVVNLFSANTVTNTSQSSITVRNNAFQSGIFDVQWNSKNDSVTFNLATQASSSSNIYTAIGFSTDAKMVSSFQFSQLLNQSYRELTSLLFLIIKGSDDVVACVYSTSLKGVVRYYNQGKSPAKQATINGISNPTVTYENGVLKCSFTRSANISNDANFYNFANSYYLLAAYGTTEDSGLN